MQIWRESRQVLGFTTGFIVSWAENLKSQKANDNTSNISFLRFLIPHLIKREEIWQQVHRHFIFPLILQPTKQAALIYSATFHGNAWMMKNEKQS